MASKTPIVASDLPSIRDILNEENAVFFEPDNPKSLALAIKQLLEDVNLAKKVAHQGHQDVQKYTWDNRAKEILDLIVQNSSFWGINIMKTIFITIYDGTIAKNILRALWLPL